MEREEKEALREQAQRRVRALSADERRAKSAAACAHLLDVPEIQRAETVLFYAPLPDELDIWPALHAFTEAGKRVILPKCRTDDRVLLCIEIGDLKNDLVLGTFDILEPKSDHGISLAEIEVVVAPARAFDRRCNRLGRGAGYYDRFFVRPGLRVFKCGIGYDCQVFPSVPMLPHDVPVDAVVTESTVIRCD